MSFGINFFILGRSGDENPKCNSYKIKAAKNAAIMSDVLLCDKHSLSWGVTQHHVYKCDREQVDDNEECAGYYFVHFVGRWLSLIKRIISGVSLYTIISSFS